MIRNVLIALLLITAPALACGEDGEGVPSREAFMSGMDYMTSLERDINGMEWKGTEFKVRRNYFLWHYVHFSLSKYSLEPEFKKQLQSFKPLFDKLKELDLTQ
jgi:hypothetical protein